MASPPYSHSYPPATSPPYPSNAQLPQPQKRRQSEMPSSASQPSLKRRKASALSTTSAPLSAHPLRQTSFPPENASRTSAYSRSPSVDAMSLVSGSAVGGAVKKKRGRKPKNSANDDASLVGGRTKSTISGTSGRRKRRQSEVSAEDEEEGGEEMAIETVARTQEERAREVEHRALLVRQLDPEQMSRYEAYRSGRLGESVVRRIVNQTLSQSAPASVILAVRSVAKIFAGEMVEGARRVQTQWLEASGEDQTTGLPSPPAENDTVKEKEMRRGPLLPDHLREALRRLKLERDGGLSGQLGLWQLQQNSGVERFGAKSMGKRLLK
ncbi:Histone-fold containing protein [Venustampulla echinocandica]|uniref:Histone-fold containing protein n=1 Tax=Venustampulla echinocandica TaxID=2656787 RepID=A0A370TTG3_9HELO|nr:Histone-fold containing protein [Venustampulla echinocandica]RDL38778.1 Histone-fold containing protein [Venustampulla echinocandica]